MINELFKELTQEQRDVLVDSFNQQKDNIIVLDDGRFLAVFLANKTGLIIQEETNNWTCGNISDSNNQ